MDVFRFTNPTNATKMEQGRFINGLKSKMWIERYDQAGEFKFVADAKSSIRNKLPIGAFVSHVDSTEIMIVENHEIIDNNDRNPEIIISGRGFETFFENRIVGSNKTFPASGDPQEYLLTADYIWNQIVTLISNHILPTPLLDDNNQLQYTSVITDIGGTGTSIERSLKRADLYSCVLDLLGTGGLGIKVIRPGPWSPLDAGSPNLAVVIHQGIDRTSEIIFSQDTGEIASADYLWSNKSLKNAVYVYGRWVETVVTTTGKNEYDRRWMMLDASDLDNQDDSAPGAGRLNDIVIAMQQRANAILLYQNDTAITRAEVSKTARSAVYRKDFDVGDLITVNGSYNETTSMRVSEYVEMEDETGASGYPTLTLV